MELLEKTLSYAKELSSKYLVYHHNNCRIIPGEKETVSAFPVKIITP